MKKNKPRAEHNDRLQLKDSRFTVLAIGLGLTLVLAVFALAGFFDILELKSQDLRFSLRGPRPASVESVVVAIDDESLNGWTDSEGKAKYMPERWIWPRDFHAQVVRNLKEAGARIIAFDIVFSESSKRDPKQDQVFAQAIADAGNVVMAERHVLKEDHSLKTETLIPPLEAAKLDKGHILSEPGADNFVRVLRPLYFNSAGDLDPEKPNLDMAILRHLSGQGKQAFQVGADGRSVMLGDKVIPLNENLTADINFLGPVESVPTFPYHAVFEKSMDMSVFKGKVVYVGSTTEILHDNHRTPFAAKGSLMPGVEFHAHFLDTLMSGRFIKRSPAKLELLILLALGAITSMLTFRVNAFQGTLVMGIIAGTYAFLCIWAFSYHDYIMPLVSPLSSVFLAFAGLATYRGMLLQKKARTYRGMFSKYVSRQIVDEILKNPGAVRLGGEMKEVSILFSDVRGFTALSETLEPPEVLAVLNEYLTAMVDIVIANNGTLDKYIGDAIMAVWGSPLADPHHQENAVKTAVQMMEALHKLQAKWKAEGKSAIDIGIGINSGRVVAGNMGHPDFKMDYTVIGDDVNLASRMESANKEMKSHVLITGSTLEGCKDLVEVIAHPPLKVKGKEKPIEMYEVVGWKGQGRAPWAVPLP